MKPVNKEKMGGNTRAIDRQTGEIIALAKKLDFTVIHRTEFVRNARRFFLILDTMYQNKYKEPLWENLDVIKSGMAFNGSAAFLFDLSINDEEFKRVKPLVGDIDVTIPRQKLANLFELLSEHEGERFSKRIAYIGQNKFNVHGYQINALFSYKIFDDEFKRIKLDPFESHIPFQVDFEASEYENGKPNVFSKFAHNSNWKDIQNGLKGVSHKYLLQNIVRGISAMKDAVLLTPKSSHDIKSPKFRVKKFDETPREFAFSVDRGLRKKFIPVLNDQGEEVFFKGKKCYKELPTEESIYITELPKIFDWVFKSVPTKEELEQLNSYIGLLELCKKYLTRKQINETYNFLIDKNLWSKDAQQLSRDSWKEDFKIKYRMIQEFRIMFPHLKSKRAKGIKKMIRKYYSKYGV